MLRLDLDTRPGGVTCRWKVGKGLSLHRRDGSLILTINAPYADERSVMTAAHALNFMLGDKHAHTRTHNPISPDTSDNQRDGAQA